MLDGCILIGIVAWRIQNRQRKWRIQFARFLESAAFPHGSQLVSSAIAGDRGVGRTTVDGYLKISFDLTTASTLPVFPKRAKRAMAATAKFYFFDTGVFRALRPKGPLDRPDGIDGRT